MWKQTAPAIPLIAILIGVQPAAGQSTHEHGAHAHGKALGEVQFETSCAPHAAKLFNEAMLYQHSFWYSAAKETFEKTLQADPGCVIAYWGIAQALLLNPFGPPPPKNLVEGLAALEKAEQSGLGSERERDFIDALKQFFVDHDKRSHRERLQRYAGAMEKMAAAYPEDDEAQIYFALALNIAASPNDKTYALPLRAAGILEPIFRRKPQHPGVAHYLVHSYDYPPIAHKGVEAARRYAAIAGSSPHALHMPSHIFTRVGYWRESIESNQVSAKVAKQDKEPDDQLHAMDYLVYAYLQLGQDDKALQTLNDMRQVSGVNAARHTGPFALAASEARYHVERANWLEAAELTLRPSRFAHVDALTHFARAIGAARSDRIGLAKASTQALTELATKLREAKDAYWAEQVEIQQQVAEAWILHAEGKPADALRKMQAAADAEDWTEKHVVTPGPLAPARELYGAMLLLVGNARDALVAFETTLGKEPNRLGALLGAGKAAVQAGLTEKGREHFHNALTIASEGHLHRAEVREAAAYLAANR
jgi:tetratricopeptide (TPR) repeat protein